MFPFYAWKAHSLPKVWGKTSGWEGGGLPLTPLSDYLLKRTENYIAVIKMREKYTMM